MTFITDKSPIYFSKEISMTENICIGIYYVNKKIKIFDISNNIKISIIKNIDKSSNNGKYILYTLGYNIDNYDKLILKCTYSNKSCIFNKKINNVLLILVNYNGSIIVYKYNIHKNNIYSYDYTLMQDRDTVKCLI